MTIKAEKTADGRVILRQNDGSGQLAGSISLDYPQAPNVTVPEHLLETDEIEENEGKEPVFDLSDGFTKEDLEALGNKVSELTEDAMCMTRRALLVGGAAAIVAGTIAGAAPAAAALPAQTSVSAPTAQVLQQQANAQQTANRAKTKSCARAQQRLKAAQKNGKRAQIRSAKRAVAKRCNTRAGVPGDAAATFNLDGTVRHSANWFRNANPNTPAARRDFAAAVANVSGTNYRDQSNLPHEQRVGFPQNAPQWLIKEGSTPQGAYLMNKVNAKAGDTPGVGAYRYIEDARFQDGALVETIEYIKESRLGNKPGEIHILVTYRNNKGEMEQRGGFVGRTDSTGAPRELLSVTPSGPQFG